MERVSKTWAFWRNLVACCSPKKTWGFLMFVSGPGGLKDLNTCGLKSRKNSHCYRFVIGLQFVPLDHSQRDYFRIFKMMTLSAYAGMWALCRHGRCFLVDVVLKTTTTVNTGAWSINEWIWLFTIVVLLSLLVVEERRNLSNFIIN